MDSAPLIVRPSIRAIVPFYWLGLIALIAVPSWGWYHPPRIDWLFVIPGVILLWTGAKHLATRFAKLIVDADKISLVTGYMAKVTRTVPIAHVQHVRVEQTVRQRMFGTGDLILESAGGSGRVTIENIDRPQEIADAILSRLNKQQRSSGTNV